jgi:CHAT domain-containing protein/tetratricopeptide (TPR) repeat protein
MFSLYRGMREGRSVYAGVNKTFSEYNSAAADRPRIVIIMIMPKRRQALVMALSAWVFCLLLGGASGKSVGASFGLNASASASASTDAAQVMQQGRSAYQAGQYSQAIAFWQQAVTSYQRQGDRLNQALSLSYLALAQQQVGDLPNASRSIANSLDLLNLKAPNQARILAQVLNTQGSLQFAQGQVEAALTTWQRATAIYQELNEPSLRIGSLLNQAQAQQSLGLLSQARKTLTAIEQLLEQQPDRQLQAQGLRSLGNLLLLTGELPRSRQAFTTSLNIAEKLGAPSEIAATLISLGNAARLQNQPDQALQFYQRVGTIAPNTLLQTQAELNQISLQIDRGQAVANLLATIPTHLQKLPLSRSSIYARIHFAQSLMQLGKRGDRAIYRSAADHLANAVQSARTLGDRRAETYALGYLGQLYEQVGQRAQAEKLTQKALLIAQTINTPEITYQWQWQMGRLLRSQDQIASAKQSYADAFQSLQSIRTDLAAASPDLQFSFRERVEPVYREFVEVLLSPPNSSATNPTTEDLQQSRQVIESLRLAELDNFFRTACLEGKAVAIDRIANTQTQSAVIYPIILPDRLAIILSTPGKSLQYYNVNVSQSELETTLEQFRQYLERPITTPEGKRIGKQIYDWMIRPIAAELDQQSLDTLVFVLDGALRNVPLAALYDGQQYLIEKYGIALSPGLQLVNPQPIQNRQLKAIAAGLTEGRHGFTALANVGLELQEIQAEVSSRVLLNQTFTSEALQQQVQALPYPIVHLATHGQFSSDASQTFVLAWDRPINVNELSALLSNREDLSEQAIELLVLSACETAQGDKRAALGLAGVAVQAGAKSTLASLWSLDDESGAKFIGAFYRELAKGQVSKAAALRQAQISLLRDRNFRHPRYWAPYVLLGNWL